MGEISTRSGVHGEEIIEKFLKEIIGYDNIQTNVSINCVYQNRHSSSTKRQSHGADAIVYSKNHLKDDNLEIGIVSVKHTKDKYPELKTFDSLFQKYFKELVYTISCFKRSPLNSQINQSIEADEVKSTDYTGIIFWLSNKDKMNDGEWNIRKKITNNLTSTDNDIFDKILIVDNDIFEFLYHNLSNIKKTFKKVEFVYPRTGYNISNNNLGYGSKMPLLYLNSSIIPLRIENGGQVYLYLLIKDEFSEESFISLINLAKNINSLQATHTTYFSFPNYNKFEHEQIINRILSLKSIDEKFKLQIKVVKHNIDFRNNE